MSLLKKNICMANILWSVLKKEFYYQATDKQHPDYCSDKTASLTTH